MLSIKEFQQLPPTERMVEIYSVLLEINANRRPTDEELREFALFYMIKTAKDNKAPDALKRDFRNKIISEDIKLPQYFTNHEKKMMRKHMEYAYAKYLRPEKHVQDEFGEYIHFLKTIT